jgi:hypothetical protein
MSIRTAQPFVGAGYRSSSLNVSAQRCINFYLEADKEGKTPAALFGRPGTTLFAELPGSGFNRINGMHVTFDGRVFVIRGDRLFELFADSSSILRGTIATVIGPVFMSDNGAANNIKGNQMLITDGNIYVYDFGTNLLEYITAFWDPLTMTYTDPIVPMLSSTFQDGYGIASQPDTQNVFVSNLYDFRHWEALDVAQQEGNPDNVVGLISNGQDLWVLGTTSYEVWFNSGAGASASGAAYPFQRRSGSLTNIGCSSATTIATLNTIIFWVGGGKFGQGQVFMSDGYSPRRISTHAIESYITSLGNVSNAFGYTKEWRGHLFYFITFPSAEDGNGRTFCYDIATDSWSEASTLNELNGFEGRYCANSHIFWNNRHYVSNFRNGNIFEEDENEYTDNGVPMISRRLGYHISNNEDRLSLREVQFELEGGVGTQTGQGFNPQAQLRISTDYGHTYGPQLTSDIGKVGGYLQRCIFRRLGYGRDFVLDFSITDPVKRVVLNCLTLSPNGPF